MFLLTNTSNNTTLNCSLTVCYPSQWWNGSFATRAILMRIPTFLPVPVFVTDSALILTRNRRNFGIIAEMIAAVVAAMAVTMAAAAPSPVTWLPEQRNFLLLVWPMRLLASRRGLLQRAPLVSMGLSWRYSASHFKWQSHTNGFWAKWLQQGWGC